MAVKHVYWSSFRYKQGLFLVKDLSSAKAVFEQTSTKRQNSIMFKLILVLCVVTTVVHCKSVLVGQTYEHGVIRRVYEKSIEASGIPLFKREQEVLFEYPLGDQMIKGIAIKDMQNSNAEPSITRGGLGFNFVNIKLKSERGSGYNFLIEIYA